MKADDAADFKRAMILEANTHSELGHWEVWLKADVLSNQDILPSV
jgi:hypothetical protein